MYFKPGKSIFAVAFASLLWSAQVAPANAATMSSDIIIDNFTTVGLNLPGFPGTAQTDPGNILGTREVRTGPGNVVAIGGGKLSVSADQTFDAGIRYFMNVDDGGRGFDLTNGDVNTGLSIGGITLNAFNPGNDILQWSSFKLGIFAQGPEGEITPTADYMTSFAPNPDDGPPMDGNDVLTLGALFVNFNDFSKNLGFTFADVGLISFELFSPEDPSVTFTGPFAASVSVVPLPASLPLFLSGLAGLGVIGRRRKKKAALQAG